MVKAEFPKAGQEVYLIIAHDTRGEYIAAECRGFKDACNKYREHKKFLGNNIRLAQVLVSYGQDIL